MLTDAERERMRARYFFDDRGRIGNEPVGGYGYDYGQMFRDLERAEAVIKKYRMEHPERTDSKAGKPAGEK